ncbi:FHA domain-containing protein [Pseudoscardovia radai]|uniref:FHA domain-containing protein n=1 Tax=Pseudoscardovia radai TaxID=987066 RepID=UPI003995C343
MKKDRKSEDAPQWTDRPHCTVYSELPVLPPVYEPWKSQNLDWNAISQMIGAVPEQTFPGVVPTGAQDGTWDSGVQTYGSAIPQQTGAAWQQSDQYDMPSSGATVLELQFSDGQACAFTRRGTVGRMPPAPDSGYDSYVVLVDASHQISRHHMEFGLTDMGQAWVMDAGSANGTWLIHEGSSMQLEPGVPVSVVAGDSLRLGDLTAIVCVSGELGRFGSAAIVR